MFLDLLNYEEAISAFKHDYAVFLVRTTGELICTNQFGLDMFGFGSQKEVSSMRIENLMPLDLLSHFPVEIRPEHLTKGECVERVNVRKDGSEFLTCMDVRTVVIAGEQFFELRLKHRPVPENVDMHKEKLKQVIEFLQSELEAERNRSWNSANNYAFVDKILVSKLESRYPGLSQNDRYVASMIYHNLHTKEIAERLNISVSSAYSARKRLRKRLPIPQDESLYTFLHALDENVHS